MFTWSQKLFFWVIPHNVHMVLYHARQTLLSTRFKLGSIFAGHKRDSITSTINARLQMESDTHCNVYMKCTEHIFTCRTVTQIGQWLAEWVSKFLSYLEGYGRKRTQSIGLPIQTVNTTPAGCLHVWHCMSKLVQKHANGVVWYPYACGMSKCKCLLGNLSACYIY